MWRARNIARRVRGTTGLLATLLAMVTAAWTAVPALAAEPPDAAGTVTAYVRLAEWVRAFDVPALDDLSAALPIERAGAVCVQLRHRGRVVGVGIDATGDDRMVRRAAGRALSDVLGDPSVARLPVERRTQIGPRLTVELEVAGPLEPLPGRTFDHVTEQVEPGLDGLGLRRGDALALRFPAQLRAQGLAGNPQRTLLALAIEVGLPARDLATLRQSHDARVYRFATIHLVQRVPGGHPVETVRGQTLMPTSAVTIDGVRAFAHGLVNHVLSSLWAHDEPFGLMGTYHPVSDEYDPLIAPPQEQALVAFALARFAQTLAPDDPERPRVEMAANVVLLELADVAPNEPDPVADPATCAAIVYAMSARPDDPARARVTNDLPDPDPALDVLATLHRRAIARLGATLAIDAEGTLSSPHVRALVAGALARALVSSPGAFEPRQARAAVDACWRSVPPPRHVELMPWIAFAEDDLERVTGDPPRTTAALRTTLLTLRQSRIGTPGRPGPPDLSGGLALHTTGRPHATSQTARPAVFLAAALRDPRLTPPDERTAALAAHRGTMRFLLQLAVADAELWAYRTPQRAKGGLCDAVWSDVQPLAAQALALLAAAETLESVETLGGF